MEKELLLLGLLQSHNMHGYQIHEMLYRNPIIPISITKSNAYRLLNKMEQNGWVSHVQDQEGNRPVKRVYSITEKGKEEFFLLLRKNISSFSTPEFPAAACLDFFHLLPSEEIVSLLQKRLDQLQKKFEALDNLPDEISKSHLAADYLHNFYANEINWLEKIIEKLRS